ncbi:MAG TPA: TIGR02530 family flagellar biosynthesis protein [Baekduia sp.]|uniref:TIGR02530 family flagellar biosynthesis protein n=1 Tax=Baekduia sp. TaxID=2600305 RepID=UPI002D76DBE9|nr:TIGR02530 family flagellar biosynthesis protein [Baekduia sp.]HET6508866.1 TIGR02530 family flagellar biosynthesis protein [Baekduia sp.]
MSGTPFNPALVPPGISAGPDGAGAVRARTQPVRPSVQTPQGPAFADVLRDTAGTKPVTFSKHAVQRLERRQLTVDPSTMQRLQDGVDRAAGKGARDAVVLVDDKAFVVSVTNRTVVTAVGKDQMKDHVFTNIDSAVIA